MQQKKWQISRRRMLKGLGACIALPFLDAMSFAGSPYSPKRAPVRNAFFVYAKWRAPGSLDACFNRKEL